MTIETTSAPTTNKKLLDWVEEVAELTQPDSIHWCDGSAEEYDRMAQELVDAGTFERLSDAKRVADMPQLRLHAYPEGGHTVIRLLKRTGDLSTLLSGALAGE